MPFCGALEENSYTTIDDRLYKIKVVYSREETTFIIYNLSSVVV